MQYMGGKARVAAKLAPIIIDAIKRTGATVYWEPFLGGANMFTRIVPHVQTAIGSDVMPDLIMMWQAVQQGWLPPDFVSREEYAALRHAEPSALRAYVGFGCSFGGRWFEGYGTRKDRGRGITEVQGATRRSLIRDASIMKSARVVRGDYRKATVHPGWVIYCDPPYAGTKPYSGLPAWDSEEFWGVAKSWVGVGARVLVSEYAAPEPWQCVWEHETRRSLHRDDKSSMVMERLFTLEP